MVGDPAFWTGILTKVVVVDFVMVCTGTLDCDADVPAGIGPVGVFGATGVFEVGAIVAFVIA